MLISFLPPLCSRMLPDQWSIQQGAGGTDPETDKDRLQSGQLQPRYLSFSKSSNCVLFLTAIHIKRISVCLYCQANRPLGLMTLSKQKRTISSHWFCFMLPICAPFSFKNFFSFLFLGNTACL